MPTTITTRTITFIAVNLEQEHFVETTFPLREEDAAFLEQHNLASSCTGHKGHDLHVVERKFNSMEVEAICTAVITGQVSASVPCVSETKLVRFDPRLKKELGAISSVLDALLGTSSRRPN